jgi:hypothetical protein
MKSSFPAQSKKKLRPAQMQVVNESGPNVVNVDRKMEEAI